MSRAVLVQFVIDAEVREVEEDVAHPGVLPVDDPQPVAVVDEVRVEEVVVARALRRRPTKMLDAACDLAGGDVPRRHLGAPLEGRRAVVLDDPERVEAPGHGWPGVDGAQGGGDAAKGRRLAHPLERRDLALDEPRHEPALGLDEVDDVRPHPHRRGGARRLELDRPVDPEQLGVLARDPEHERPVGPAHLQVVVRDAASEHLEARAAVGPHAAHDLLVAGSHARTRSPAGSKSGSAATSPSTQLPKISTATSVPTSCSAGRYA